MERQTKHRILAILVVIGLVIILLPLFQSDKDISSDTTVIEAPPFPAEPEPSDTTSLDEQSAVEDPGTFINPPKAQYHQEESVKPPVAEIKNGVLTINTDDYRPPASKRVIEAQTSSQDPVDQVMQLDEDKQASDQRARQIFRNAHYQPSEKPDQPAKETDGLSRLKQPVWVIQLGSFKHKSNAERLVNKLRSRGYPAFMQSVAKHTRVYVGPKPQQKSAKELALQIHSELKLKGVIVSYKPLKI